MLFSMAFLFCVVLLEWSIPVNDESILCQVYSVCLVYYLLNFEICQLTYLLSGLQ